MTTRSRDRDALHQTCKAARGNRRQPGLLLQLAASGLFERLIDADEPARHRPAAGKRLEIALDQNNLQILVVQAEDSAIDGQGGSGVGVGVSHGQFR